MPKVDMSSLFTPFDGERLLAKLKVLDEDGENLSKCVRVVRAQMLAQSDWTQAADAPLSSELVAEYKVYRQLLRDLPSDPDFPNIMLPKEPVAK